MELHDRSTAGGFFSLWDRAVPCNPLALFLFKMEGPEHGAALP